MTRCSDLAAVLDATRVATAWECLDGVGDGPITFTTGRTRMNSEPVRLRVRLVEDSLLASDGGDTLATLRDMGFDVDDPVLDALWRETLRALRVEEADGKVFVQMSIHEAAHWLPRLADALVALDALQIVGVPARQKPRTLANEVETYLSERYGRDRVRRQPSIRLSGGLRVAPALVANPENREQILIQPGASTSVTQSYDHAFATFSLANRGGIPHSSCLTILGGEVATWNALRLRALSDVTFIGFWSHRPQVMAFLDGIIPDDPLMLPPGVDVPLLHI